MPSLGLCKARKRCVTELGKVSLTKKLPDEHPDRLIKKRPDQYPTGIDDCLIKTLRE